MTTILLTQGSFDVKLM